MTWEPIATRGSRLALAHEVWADRDQTDDPIAVELLTVTEVSDTGLLRIGVAFDPDDIDAAFAELDARYLAGEAGAHSRTWAAIVSGYSRFNQEERPTADWVNVDHRRGTPFASSHLNDVIRGAKDLTPDMCVRIEAVHRLENFGAVITNVSDGTSQDGIGAEWRMIQVLTLEGDRVIRCELFDESDLDAALARFDELGRPAPNDPGQGQIPDF